MGYPTETTAMPEPGSDKDLSVKRAMLFRQPYPVRKAGQRGKESTVPPHVPFKLGQEVIAYFSQSLSFVLYAPKGVEIDESLLLQAVRVNFNGSDNG